MEEKVVHSLNRLESYVEREDFSGYDPYDALRSPIVRTITMGLKYPRIAFTQALKILPVNLRPILGVPKGHNPKGLGLFLGGYVKRYALTEDARYLGFVERLFGLLEETRSRGYSGYCWGYNFDWQSRTEFAPRYTPTVVNTSFIAHAFLDAFEILGCERYLAVARSAADFMLSDLNVTREEDRICFSYTPRDDARVHNANMLGAGFLARLYAHTSEERLLDSARRAAAYVVHYQRDDGSWYYAEREMQRWIDNHHTGFVLEGLHRYCLHSGDSTFEESLQRGLDFYTGRFFLDDGQPKFFHDRVYPVDIHCSAQAVVILNRLRSMVSDPLLPDRVVDWMIDRMQGPKGYFYYRRGRNWVNKIPYMRWSEAWAYHALTSYLHGRHGAGEKKA